MSQSLTKLYAHIVFSTKDRFPFLSNNNLKSELHAYIGGVLRTLNSQPVVIDGVTDHVHILCAFSKNHSISKSLEKLNEYH